MKLGLWIVVGLVVLGVALMYDDTIDNRGTSSPFDPNELTYTAIHHEHFVVAVFILAFILFVRSFK